MISPPPSFYDIKNGFKSSFDYIRRKSRSKSGKMYSPQTVKRYISTLTSSKLIERKKNKYFKLS